MVSFLSKVLLLSNVCKCMLVFKAGKITNFLKKFKVVSVQNKNEFQLN